jgi:hypothetical protein
MAANQQFQERVGKVAERYNALTPARQPYVDRARQMAKLTIPMLFPEEGQTTTAHYPKPYQSIGARGVKNLAAKIVNALFPPNASYWRYELDPDSKRELENQPEVKTKFEASLALIEKEVSGMFDLGSRRAKLNEAAMQLQVAGNVLLHQQEDSKVRAFRLDSYVVKRDHSGNVLEVVACEQVAAITLPEDVRLACGLDGDIKSDVNVKVYTHIKRVDRKFEVAQEINGEIVPGSDGSYPLDVCPWHALRFYAEDGSDYGRSYVEEHSGDLITHEALSQAITEGSVAAARILFLVRPGSATKASVLEKTPNGGIAVGDANDVSVVQLDKYSDFRVALELLREKTESLSKAFMLNASIQRQAERVTATEVEYGARELEDVLGGIYSMLSMDIQLPMIRVDLHMLERKGVTPAIPAKVAKPVPIAGLAALGRGNDAEKLKLFIGVAAEAQMTSAVNFTEYLNRMAMALGVDTNGLVKTQDEIQAEMMQAQMLQAGQAAMPELVKGAMAPEPEAPAQ